MREDMFKIIVERPRSGRSRAAKTKLRHDKCEDRSRVSGRRLAWEIGGTKYLNENLNPLKRYLHKQVGRRWDDVFSDICQHLDTGSTVKMHVREHLDDFVERHAQLGEDGELWIFGWRARRLVFSGKELYVDPADGCLKATVELCRKLGFNSVRKCNHHYHNQIWGRTLDPIEDKLKHLGGLHWHVQFSGIWYEVTLSAPPTNLYTRLGSAYPMYDRDLYKDLEEGHWKRHERFLVTKKMQLSRKALRAHGLRNQPELGENHYG